MTEIQYIDMVGMLIKATNMRTLSWSFNSVQDLFYAKLGDCQVCVTNIVDFNMQTEEVRLELYNSDGNMFDSISTDSVLSIELRSLMNQLFETIRDSYYKIRESEEMILSSLRKLTSTHISAPEG